MSWRGRASPVLPYVAVVALSGALGLAVHRELERAGGAMGVQWATPRAFVLLAACALLAWVGFHLRRARAPTLAFSQVPALVLMSRGVVARLAALPEVLRVVAVGLIVCALARPQTLAVEREQTEGIDIAIVLDLSKSMEERDLRRDRLDAGQRTIRGFVRGLRGDRVGLVVFAQAAMLQCPLTDDYAAFARIVADLSIGDVPEMGTALGDALALALGSLRRSDARSKVAILLSDGDSNWTTEFTPDEAVALAARMGVRVFAILLGTEGERAGRYRADPALLRRIAADTGGRFFRAGDDDALAASFAAVRAELAKTPREVVSETRTVELFPIPLVPALILLVLELLLRMTRWRRVP